MTVLHINASTLGRFMSPEFCPRCMWILMKAKLPFQKSMPAVMFALERLEKRLLGAHIRETGEAPECFGCFGDAGAPLDIGLISYRDPETGVELAGIPDAVAPLGDDSFLVIDYKTGLFKGKDDPWLPVYAAQVNAYAYLLAHQEEEYRVTRGGILYFEVETDIEDDALLESVTASGFGAHVRATPVEVKIRSDVTPLLLKRAKGLFRLEAPPEGRTGCRDCELLRSLMELFRVAELADNLQTVGEAKQRALMDRLMQSRLRHALRAATQGRGQCTHADVDPEAMIVWDFSAD